MNEDSAEGRPGWSVGRRLHFERRLRGWTEEETALRVRRLAAFLGQPDPDLTPLEVAGWESGARLSPARLSMVCLVLDVPTREALGLVDVMQLPEWVLLTSYSAGSIPQWRDETKRRELLSLLTATGVVILDAGRLDSAMAQRTHVDRELVDGLGAAVRRLAGQWDSMPAPVLRAVFVRHLEVIKTLLAGPLAPGLRRDLMAVGGQAGALAGLVSRFVGQDDDARRHLGLAGQLAGAADDAGTQALAAVWTADTLSGVQRGGEPVVEHRHVLDLLDRAEDLAGPSTPPSVRALILLRQAEEHAAAGEVDEARVYLDRADSVASVADGTDPGLYGIGWRSHIHLAFRGNVEMLCGRPAEAHSVLEDALGRLAPDAVSNRTSIMTDMAAAHAHLGNLDRAVPLLAMAWSLAASDDRKRRIVGVRRRDLTRWAEEPAVRGLDELLATT